MKTIKIPTWGIVIDIELDEENRPIGGNITSDLHEDFEDIEEPTTEELQYDACIDAIESLVLAHAMAEIDVTTPQYIQGLETAINACANNY